MSVLLKRSDGAPRWASGGANFSGMLEGRRSRFSNKINNYYRSSLLGSSLFLAILTKNKNDSSVISSEEIEEVVVPGDTNDNKAIIPMSD